MQCCPLCANRNLIIRYIHECRSVDLTRGAVEMFVLFFWSKLQTVNVDGSIVGILKCCSTSQAADRDVQPTCPLVATFINRCRHRVQHQTQPIHQIDECAPLETLRGNDHHASSRSDCHLYLPSLSFCYTPGSMVDNDSFLNGADTSFINASGPHCIVPKFDRQPTAEERLFALLGTVGADAHRCNVFGLLGLSVPLHLLYHTTPYTFRDQSSY